MRKEYPVISVRHHHTAHCPRDAGERLRRRRPDPYGAARRSAALNMLAAQGCSAGQQTAPNFGMQDQAPWSRPLLRVGLHYAVGNVLTCLL